MSFSAHSSRVAPTAPQARASSGVSQNSQPLFGRQAPPPALSEDVFTSSSHQQPEKLIVTARKPNEPLPALQERFNAEKHAPIKFHPSTPTSIPARVEQQGNDHILSDFALKSTNLFANLKTAAPVKLKEVTLGQTLIYKPTGQEIKVTQLGGLRQQSHVDGVLIKTPGGQAVPKVLHEKTRYQFKFEGQLIR